MVCMLEQFFLTVFLVQVFHSIEELTTGFYKRWYLMKMPFSTFLLFEIVFTLFWIFVLLTPQFPFRLDLQKFFLLLMFANGVQHLVWWGVIKRYVPGLITAFLHVIVFAIYYFDAF
ncbi:MAG TPA: hypothetical protein DCG34_00300 [Clostridiales bacterium]|nr:hypothetical protein [Clostridiales bacterium]